MRRSWAPATLVYVGRFDLAEFAVVLEPDEPLRTARRAFYAGQAALADALAAFAPPEKAIHFVWPGTIEIDGGVAGGGQLGWPDTPEDEPPPWLVFGGMIRTVSMAEGDPGLRPLSAALEDEGFDDFGSGQLVESFARHLMVQIDGWQEHGFKAVARDYLTRLAPEQGREPQHRRQRRPAGAAGGQGRCRAPQAAAAAVCRAGMARSEDRRAEVIHSLVSRASEARPGTPVCLREKAGSRLALAIARRRRA